ncbi:MAG: hypothetical protein QOJ51_5582, partial [Acidobacteriaceae bacterium]|nr:hypothetical protein [Acidobacteriaceae bacterium]
MKSLRLKRAGCRCGLETGLRVGLGLGLGVRLGLAWSALSVVAGLDLLELIGREDGGKLLPRLLVNGA